jgi:hypothetical protein
MDHHVDRFAFGTDDNNPDSVWVDGHMDDALPIPAFVFRRLTAIGAAYRLHYLSQLLGYDEETRLDHLQAEQLADEIEFVVNLVLDPALRDAAPPVLDFIRRYARSRPTSALVIELES